MKSNFNDTRWAVTYENKPLRTYPNLLESKWIGDRPPYNHYDKIDVRRLMKSEGTPKAVVFIIPGTNNSAERFFMNDENDSLACREEKHNMYSYLANRGYDIYCMSYRTHYVSQDWNLQPDDLKFMADWGWEVWLNDIKAAVNKVKEISGVEKIYLGGQSFGGGAVMNFASMYWKEDIKGIILLDPMGAHGGKGNGYPYLPGGPTNTYDLPAKLKEMMDNKNWAQETNGKGSHHVALLKVADENPEGPAFDPYLGKPIEPQINPKTGKPYENILEWYGSTVKLFSANLGPAVEVAPNKFQGFNELRKLLHERAVDDNWWPVRLALETMAITDWDNCPYMPYDFDDHYCEIDVPLIGFKSGFLGGMAPFIHGIKNLDFTGYMLAGYGHGDVWSGTYAAQDVYLRMYEWLERLERA